MENISILYNEEFHKYLHEELEKSRRLYLELRNKVGIEALISEAELYNITDEKERKEKLEEKFKQLYTEETVVKCLCHCICNE